MTSKPEPAPKATKPAQKPRAPTPGAAMHAIVAAAHADWLFDPKFNGWDAKE